MKRIAKSFNKRRDELRQSLYRLEGALERYKKTREQAELGTVAIELRGLLLGEALLLNLAEEKAFPLEIYTIPADLKTLQYGMKDSYVWAGDIVSLTPEKPWTQRIAIKDWLEVPVIYICDSPFSPKRLIAEIASSLGPAHYPTKISRALDEMSHIQLGGDPSYFRTLLNFAGSLLKLGLQFLKAFS